jgi:hypothetical protein
VEQNLYQNQQNKQSSFISTELTEHKKNTTCDVGNPGPGLGQAQKGDGCFILCSKLKGIRGCIHINILVQISTKFRKKPSLII